VRRLGERVEVLPHGRHLGAVPDLVAHAEEDVLDLALDLREQMQPAAAHRRARDGDVDAALRRLAVGEPEQLLAARRDRLLEAAADAVQQHAAFAVAHAAKRLRQLRAAAGDGDARLLELGLRQRGADARERLLLVGLPVHGGEPIQAILLPSSGRSVRPRCGRTRYATSPVAHRGRINSEIAVASIARKNSGVSAYDAIARLYDPWSRSVVEDVEFYVEEAVRSGGPVLELGVGTGRIAVPVAAAGIGVVGVDLSAGMLEVARERAELAGVEIDLRRGDMREPPVEGRFPLVVIPFRSLLHMETDADRRAALRAVASRLSPGGRFVFDVFTPAADDIADTHGRWLEREPGIWERADWNEHTR